MALVNWLRLPVTPRHITAWATEVAQHCQADVAARLVPSVRSMSLPEARGYIRARLAAVLDQEMPLVAQHLGANPQLELAVRLQATDEIVRMTIGDLLKSTQKHASRRAA